MLHTAALLPVAVDPHSRDFSLSSCRICFFFCFFFLLDFIKIFAVWLRRIYRKQKFKWKKKGASSNDRCLQRLCVPFFLLLLFRSRRLLLWPLPSGKHIVKQLKREKKTSDSLIPLSADEREM